MAKYEGRRFGSGFRFKQDGIFPRLLRGEPLDLVARQTTVSVARPTEWRSALAGAASALKERERYARDDEIARPERTPDRQKNN